MRAEAGCCGRRVSLFFACTILYFERSTFFVLYLNAFRVICSEIYSLNIKLEKWKFFFASAKIFHRELFHIYNAYFFIHGRFFLNGNMYVYKYSYCNIFFIISLSDIGSFFLHGGKSL